MTYLANMYNLTLADIKEFLDVAEEIYNNHNVNEKLIFSEKGLCLEFKHRMNDEITAYHIIEYFIPENDSYLNDRNKDGIYTQKRHDFLQRMLAFESPKVLYEVWYQEYKRRNYPA